MVRWSAPEKKQIAKQLQKNHFAFPTAKGGQMGQEEISCTPANRKSVQTQGSWECEETPSYAAGNRKEYNSLKGQRGKTYENLRTSMAR